MKVVKWNTGAFRGRGKSLIPSTIITLAIVAMLILSGPAQAVAVLISGGQPSYTEDSEIEFQVTMELNDNDKYVPLTNISLDLTGNVSKRAVFDLNGEKISGNCIEMKPVSVPGSKDFGYGSGYGYDKIGTGYGYDFGYGYGYGYGYGGGGETIRYVYNVSIKTDCLSAGRYTVVATLNTDQNIAFHSSPFNFELTAGNKLNADVEIKPETLNRRSKGTITAFITSEEFDVNEIIGSTVSIKCDGCSSAHAVKWNKADKKFIAKFKTQELHNVKTGDSVRFVVTGKLNDGTVFEGSDTIRVIDKGKKGHEDEDDEEDDDECDDEDAKEHDDECDEDHVKDHDDDKKEHKPEKNKNGDKKNSNNNGGKGKNVIVNNIDIHDNTGPVTVNIYNSNSNNGGKNKK